MGLPPCALIYPRATATYLVIRAAPGKKADFEVIVQEIAHGLYHLEAGISDVRVGHPSCDEVLWRHRLFRVSMLHLHVF